MGQQERAAAYQKLKAAGVKFEKHYRDYSEAELVAAVERLEQGSRPPEDPPDPGPAPEDPPFDPDAMARAMADFTGHQREPEFGSERTETTAQLQQEKPSPRPPNLEEMAGERLNTVAADEVVRVDEQGRQWLQEEVRKPAYPKPRGRRVLTYMDTGTREEKVKVGDYVETFEVPGQGTPRAAEVKITLPSYQVGIYRDPRFPRFKVHTYNGNDGFDLFDVQDYYGGAELVPAEIKKVYIENVLCYDIRTTVRAIMAEYRHLQNLGKVQ